MGEAKRKEEQRMQESNGASDSSRTVAIPEYDPEKPSVVYVEMHQGRINVDWTNFQAPELVIFAVSKAMQGVTEQITMSFNQRPVPPRPSWVGKKA